MKAACLIVFLCSACGTLPKRPLRELPSYKRKYELVDKSGKFMVVRESGTGKKSNEYIVKRQVYTIEGGQKKIVEKSVAIATLGNFKNNIPILRPKISQYVVWLDKKRYFSELKLDVPSKSLLLKMKTPEERRNDVQKLSFPKGNGAYCFFSAVMECAGMMGFIKKAVAKKAGTMRFHLIWDGHPYIQEQYLNLPSKAFSWAELVYDGISQEGDRRFSLNVGNQTIFYFTDTSGILKKMFWVSQGLSMTAL